MDRKGMTAGKGREPPTIRVQPRAALAFALIALFLYAVLFVAAEVLVLRNGHANPFYKIRTAERADYDWVILGASHAMPLDFDGVEEQIEARTGKTLINLAGPGTGPFYNRFVLDEFLRTHSSAGLLYVVDAFAFEARTWNEARLEDTKLLRKTPFDPSIAVRLAGHVLRDGISAVALADYLTGFSKINDHTRFQRDAWEGEAMFERAQRPSEALERKRIDTLYPDGVDAGTRAHYLAVLRGIVDRVVATGARVVVMKPPLPARFERRLPQEAAFDAALADALAGSGASIIDLSDAIEDPSLFFDTDHLNRAGVERFVETALAPVLIGNTP